MESKFILGWEEWVALPDLGLPAIRAKIDTGARTSALHAALIEPFGTRERPMVRFVVHPRRGRTEPEIVCTAPIADKREVTSSNGESETRYVIVTTLSVGGKSWPIEVTLTNRETMSARMLIGRQAIRADMFVDATGSFRQPKLSYKLYGKRRREQVAPRALRFCLLTRQPEAASVRRLAAAAAARGHAVDTVELAGPVRFDLSGPMPGLSIGGRQIAHYDVIVPRIGAGTAETAAVVRQLELMGGVSLNPAQALDRLRNRYAVAQALAKAHVPAAGELALAAGEPAASPSAPSAARRLRFLVIGKEDVAVIDVSGTEPRAVERRHLGAERKLARRAAAALKLGIAAIDVAGEDEALHVAAVAAVPLLGRFEAIAGVDAARLVIEAGESRMRRHVPAVIPEAEAP